MNPARVEILYFEGCPNYAEARALVERIAADLQVLVEVDLIEVADAGAAAALGFLGSPSVRVNGRDVEPDVEGQRDPSFSCRIYRTENGLSAQPCEAWIREAAAARALM